MNKNRFFRVLVLGSLAASVAATTAVAAPDAISFRAAPECSAAAPRFPLGIDGGLTGLSRGEIEVVLAPSASQHALGIDGGLTGLSRGEIEVVLAPSNSQPGRPAGVDGGVLSLLFVREQESSAATSVAGSCTAAFAGRGG